LGGCIDELLKKTVANRHNKNLNKDDNEYLLQVIIIIINMLDVIAANRDIMQKLSVNRLSTGYGTPIVHDVSINFPEGKVSALVGPNGCGKSTLLKCMARVLQPNSGNVCLSGVPIHSLPTRKVAQQLALLPQGPIAPEGLTVRELVAQGRYPHQRLWRQWSREDERIVNDVMLMTDTNLLSEYSLDALSGGQRQRAWIAMVLAQSTPIILLDEPTTFLDLRVQVDLLNLLRTLAHEHGRTIVVVLHELNLAASYADYLVMMNAGMVQAQGSPEQVFTSDNLKKVFSLDAQILRDPHSHRLMCVPNGMPFSRAEQNVPYAQLVNAR
jgi:iron complex transport system ATP-binding protein